MKITICGSLKFMDTINKETIRLSENNIVYAPYDRRNIIDSLKTDDALNNFYNAIVDEHNRNIIDSDAIYVINDLYGEDNLPYIGEDVKKEICVAERANKLIFHYRKMEGYKYLYTVDGMNLVIPENHYFNIFKLSNLQMPNIEYNGIYEIPSNEKVMNGIDIRLYRDYIRSDNRIQSLLKDNNLNVELGSPDSTDSIERLLTIYPSNTIGRIVAFTNFSVLIKINEYAKQMLDLNINPIGFHNFVATPRIFKYSDSGKIFIVTWDLCNYY